MKVFSVQPISLPGFTVEARRIDESLRVCIAGNADMNAQTALASCLKEIHSEAIRLGIREVVCEVGELYFMSSSCFKAFVTWVTSLSAVEPSKQYCIRVRSNRKLEWQRRSVEALRCLAEDNVIVES